LNVDEPARPAGQRRAVTASGSSWAAQILAERYRASDMNIVLVVNAEILTDDSAFNVPDLHLHLGGIEP